jgi:GNAT superfamily N-acetyltransferase
MSGDPHGDRTEMAGLGMVSPPSPTTEAESSRRRTDHQGRPSTDPTPVRVRRLVTRDLDRAIDIVFRAFCDDPLWRYLLPDDGQREKWLPRFYRVFLTLDIDHHQTYGVSDPLEGVAVWRLPGQDEGGLWEWIDAGLMRLCFSPLLVPILRARAIFARLLTLEDQYAPEPHYTLDTIAVSPASQGKGLGSELMRHVLTQVDDQSMPVYTETTTPGNVGLYEHFGFTCREQWDVPETPLSVWVLYRAARRV